MFKFCEARPELSGALFLLLRLTKSSIDKLKFESNNRKKRERSADIGAIINGRV